MPGDSHKRAQRKAAGRGGRTEVPISRGRRLDALTGQQGRATEVERGGTPERLEKAVRRLNAAPAKQHVLQVPQKDMRRASDAVRSAAKQSVTVKNMSGTRSRSVSPNKK